MKHTMLATLLPTLLALAACGPDETISAYTGGPYGLDTLDGAPFATRAILDVSTPGKISGQAPCNSYFAAQTVPYPWFDTGPIAASRRACPDLAAETAFLRALAQMEFAESLGNTLILSNAAGREMVFQELP